MKICFQNKKRTISRPLFIKIAPQGAILHIFLVVAAAAEHKNYSKDDNPGAVIVEDVAEAVVVHICSSVEFYWRFSSAQYHSMQ
jgi:hypothetical protein